MLLLLLQPPEDQQDVGAWHDEPGNVVHVGFWEAFGQRDLEVLEQGGQTQEQSRFDEPVPQAGPLARPERDEVIGFRDATSAAQEPETREIGLLQEMQIGMDIGLIYRRIGDSVYGI